MLLKYIRTNGINLPEASYSHAKHHRVRLIALYDSDTQTGWLGHFAAVTGNDGENFDQFIKTAGESESKNLNAWVSSGTRFDAETMAGDEELFEIYQAEQERKRQTIIEALKDMGVSGGVVDYDVGVNRHLATVELDCSKDIGALSYQTDTLPPASQ